MKAKALGTRRGPRLRVVSPTLDTPRRIVSFDFDKWFVFGLEHFSEAEWELMHPAERPKDRCFLPGVGWLSVRKLEPDERQLYREHYGEALATWKALRGILD
jgi:hypothetical protein